MERQRHCSGRWARRSSGRVAEELAEEAAAEAAVTAVTMEAGRAVVAAREVLEVGTVVVVRVAAVRVAAGKEAGKAGLVGEEGRG